jgi:hypothetical protein
MQSMSVNEQPIARKRPAYRLRQAVEKAVLEAKLAVRAQNKARLRPNIFVIGVQKSGTTSLYGHLAKHPQIQPPLVKEVHYFDVAQARGDGWYNAHFPTIESAKRAEDAIGRAVHTFDTTPYYMFHPDVTARILRYAPDAKIIAVLRDPVARAWSHYWHEWTRGFEKLPPHRAFEAEPKRLPAPHDHVGASARDRYNHQHFSYCARSEYDLQLIRWLRHIPPTNLLCLKSENLFSQPAAALSRVAEFLDIDPFETAPDRILNPGKYELPPAEIAQWLNDRLSGSIASTQKMLGSEFTWPASQANG